MQIKIKVLHLQKQLTTHTMRARRKTYAVSRERAIEIAMNHNIVSREIAERYTDSELKEVLRELSIKAAF